MKILLEQFINKLSVVAQSANYKEHKGIINMKGSSKEGSNKIIFFGADGLNTSMSFIATEEKCDFDIYIDVDKVLGYLKSLTGSSSEVTLTISKTLTLKTDTTEFSFPLEDIKSYPEYPNIDIGELEGNIYNVSLNSNKFVNMMKKLSMTTAVTSERPVIQYCNISLDEKFMVATSTDGFRGTVLKLNIPVLNFKDSEKKVSIEDGLSYNVDPSMICKFVSLDEEINLFFTNDLLYIVNGNSICTFTFMKKENMNIQQFFTSVDFDNETPFKTILTIEGKELHDAMKVMQSVTRNEIEKLIRFELSDKKRNISTNSAIYSSSNKLTKDTGKVKINGELEGEEIMINFDLQKLNILPRYDQIRICFNKPNEPVYIYSGKEQRDFSYKYFILPCM